MHSAKIIADSISPEGVRLVTMELTYPRIIHAEMCRHRVFSRAVGSSRAIPTSRFLVMVQTNPYFPIHWGKNQKGMVADQEVNESEAAKARYIWEAARDDAVERTNGLLSIGIHKQITNRLLEPFFWLTEIVTATEWDNFFHLRCHPDAHPEIQRVATLMSEAMEAGKPRELSHADWHLPYIRDEDWEEAILANKTDPIAVQNRIIKVSTGRCARLSYLTHEGVRSLDEDVRLHDSLLSKGHMSPFEHVARPMTRYERDDRWRWIVELQDGSVTSTSWGGLEVCPEPGFLLSVLRAEKYVEIPVKRVIRGVAFEGNFNSWMQYRKTIPFEDDIMGPKP